MKKVFSYILSLSLILTQAFSTVATVKAADQPLVIICEADSTVSTWKTEKNNAYGLGTTLMLRPNPATVTGANFNDKTSAWSSNLANTTDAKAAYVRFDLSQVDENKMVKSAKFTVKHIEDMSTWYLDVYGVPDSSWKESTITFITRPLIVTTPCAGPVQGANAGLTSEFDVTIFFNESYSSGKMTLLLMTNPLTFETPLKNKELYSREAGDVNAPKLTVEYYQDSEITDDMKYEFDCTTLKIPQITNQTEIPLKTIGSMSGASVEWISESPYFNICDNGIGGKVAQISYPDEGSITFGVLATLKKDGYPPIPKTFEVTLNSNKATPTPTEPPYREKQEFSVIADTALHTWRTEKTQNMGTASTMILQYSSGITPANFNNFGLASTTNEADSTDFKCVLFKFDLTNISVTGRIIEKVELKITHDSENAGTVFDYHPVPNADWVENTVTWQTRPIIDINPIAVGVKGAAINQISYIDVTNNTLKSMSSGEMTIAMLSNIGNGTSKYSIKSKEGGDAVSPKIVVSYFDPATITELPDQDKDAFNLVMPSVPGNPKFKIESSSDLSVISLDGQITPPIVDTPVTVTLSFEGIIFGTYDVIIPACTPGRIDPTSLTISSKNNKDNLIEIGETLQFTSNVIPESAWSADVFWYVTDLDGKETSVATIDQDGLLTAKGYGLYKVCATFRSGLNIVSELPMFNQTNQIDCENFYNTNNAKVIQSTDPYEEITGKMLDMLRTNDYVTYKNILLDGINGIGLRVSTSADCVFEIRENEPSGNLLCTVNIPATGDKTVWTTVEADFTTSICGVKNLCIVSKSGAAYLNSIQLLGIATSIKINGLVVDNSRRYTELSSGDYKANVSLKTSDYSASQIPVIVMVLYNGKKMVKVVSSKITENKVEGAITKLSANMNIGTLAEGDYHFEIYLWDNVAKATPITKSLVSGD